VINRIERPDPPAFILPGQTTWFPPPEGGLRVEAEASIERRVMLQADDIARQVADVFRQVRAKVREQAVEANLAGWQSGPEHSSVERRDTVSWEGVTIRVWIDMTKPE
jgi:hypothetical protein